MPKNRVYTADAMNAVSTSRLSSQRTSRIIFWLGVALIVAAIAVFIVKRSDHSSTPAAAKAPSSAAQVKKAHQLIQHPKRTAQVARNADWAKIPASAKTAVKTFVVDGAGERNLAAAWPVTASSMKQGFTRRQWIHGDALPFQVFPELNFKVP